MSTFGGKIEEIPSISIDRFDGENVHSEIFYLSHCHSDHMRGLDRDFLWRLEVTEKNLYASEISCLILKNKFPDISLDNVLKPLDVYIPSSFATKNSTFTVKTIPAGHCPGSVMFLFITDTKKILYTGDFRINKDDIPKFKSIFSNTLQELMVIDKIYLDTTFFSKNFPYFPKREESLNEICKLTENHITNRRQHLVQLSAPAYYGYEYLFKGIYEKLKMPVHVNNIAYEFYSLIPDMDYTVTLDGSKTQIHWNCAGYNSVCDFFLDSIPLLLRITAFRWDSNLLQEGISYFDTQEQKYFVCFSTHASLEESIALIKFLKPRQIVACVESVKAEENEEMQRLIKEMLEEIHGRDELVISERKCFAVRKFKKKKYNVQPEVSRDPYGILNSPPRDGNCTLLSLEVASKAISRNESISDSKISEVCKLQLNSEFCLNDDETKEATSLEFDRNSFTAAEDVNKNDPNTEIKNEISEEIEEEVISSSQKSFEELQIKKEENEEDVLLNIIDRTVDDSELDQVDVQERVLNCEYKNSEENVILNLINDRGDSDVDVPGSTSDNVLLDIINL